MTQKPKDITPTPAPDSTSTPTPDSTPTPTPDSDLSETLKISRKDFKLVWGSLAFSLIALLICSLAPLLKVDGLTSQTLTTIFLIGSTIFLGTLCTRAYKK